MARMRTTKIAAHNIAAHDGRNIACDRHALAGSGEALCAAADKDDSAVEVRSDREERRVRIERHFHVRLVKHDHAVFVLSEDRSDL
jgi:hypothetical protein